MTVQCTGCSTRYILGEEKVPDQGLRVRCPKCKTVFRIYRARVEEQEELVTAGATGFERSETVFTNQGAGAAAAPAGRPAPPGDWGEKPADPKSRDLGKEAPEPSGSELLEREIDFDSVPPAEEKPAAASAKAAGASKGNQKERERAKRLAKVLVSDILIYNREKRDQALAEGKLMAVLGPEIKKSWETYKEKVSPEVTDSTDYFKEALNEILADGQKIF